MRFKITIEPNKKNGEIILPINYQYALSSFIYNTINKGNSNVAGWLHERGFRLENKTYKLFTFSGLNIERYKQYEDRLILQSDTMSFILSFCADDLTEPFVVGLFEDCEFSLGDRKSKVRFAARSIERLKDPVFNDAMQMKTLSPIVVTTKTNKVDRYAQYMQPGDEGYEDKLRQNLVRKYAAFCRYYKTDMKEMTDTTFKINILSRIRKKGILIKPYTESQSKIIGYQYTFEIDAPAELIKTGYFAGFGEKNSQGFGCCEII